MKKATLLLFVLLGLNSGIISAQEAILGKWMVQDKDAVVEIYKEGEKYFGRIVKLTNPTYEDGTEKVDKNNPEESLRTRKLFGLVNLLDFVWDGEQLTDGTIYSPKKGKTYDGKLWMDGNKLKVRGYIGFFFKTQTWERIVE